MQYLKSHLFLDGCLHSRFLKINCIILLFSLMTACEQGQQLQDSISSGSGIVTLSWTPPTEYTDNSSLTDLAGYNIYYGTVTGSYSHKIFIENPGVTEYLVENLFNNTTYFFSITAVNSLGVESDYSNEVARTVH